MRPVKLVVALLALSPLITLDVEALPWRTGGPQGGVIESFAAAPSDPDRLYVGTRRGLFRSDDGGTTWTKAGSRNEDVFALTVDPADPDTLFIVTADAVYKSTDGGAVWVPLDVPSGIDVSALLIDPRDSETIYIGSHCEPFFKMNSTPRWHESAGVFKSTDGGLTWEHSSNGLTGFQQCVEQLAIDPVSPDTLYATPIYSDSGYARTDDGGETWTTVSGRLPGGSVAVDPADPSRRFGTASYGGSAHFLVSGDSGETWTTIDPQILGDGPLDSFWYGEVTTDPRNGRLFLSTGSGVYRSGDGGLTWLPLEGAARDSIRGMELDPSTGSLMVATLNGLFRSDGFPWDQWEELQIGFIATGALEIVRHPSDPNTLFAIGSNRIHKTNNLGRSWTTVGEIIPSAGDRAFIAYDLEVDAGADLYVMGFSGTGNQLFRLDETGDWERISPPPSPFDNDVVTIRSIAADPLNPGELYVAQIQEIAHTVDGGETWEHLPIPHSYLEDLAIDPIDSDTVWAATGDGIMKSTDGGRRWSVSRLLDHTSELVPQKIVIAPSDPSVVYFFTRFFGPVGRTLNGGESWTTVTVPGEVTDLAISPRDPALIFASTLRDGVFRSRDGGESWEQIGEGLPAEEQFRSIAVDDLDAFVHVGTWSYGVWELPLGGEFRRRPVMRR